MNWFSYTACGTILLALVIWLLRVRSRKLGNFAEEIAKAHSIPTDKLGTLCVSDCDYDLIERAEAVSGLVGWAEFRSMARKSRYLVRILQAGNEEYSMFFDQPSVRYIAERALLLRAEMPFIAIELATSRLLHAPKLHAYQAASLYCQVAGLLSDVAIESNSPGLLKIAAKF